MQNTFTYMYISDIFIYIFMDVYMDVYINKLICMYKLKLNDRITLTSITYIQKILQAYICMYFNTIMITFQTIGKYSDHICLYKIQVYLEITHIGNAWRKVSLPKYTNMCVCGSLWNKSKTKSCLISIITCHN